MAAKTRFVGDGQIGRLLATLGYKFEDGVSDFDIAKQLSPDRRIVCLLSAAVNLLASAHDESWRVSADISNIRKSLQRMETGTESAPPLPPWQIIAQDYGDFIHKDEIKGLSARARNILKYGGFCSWKAVTPESIAACRQAGKKTVAEIMAAKKAAGKA